MAGVDGDETKVSSETAFEMQVSPTIADAVVRQMEFYLGRANLPTDYFLSQHMDAEFWVRIEVLAGFPKMMRFGLTAEQIGQVVGERSNQLEVDAEHVIVRPKYLVEEKQKSVLILRDVPETTTEDQVKELLAKEQCPEPLNIRPDIANVWFLDFDGTETAKNCLESLRDKSLNGAPVKARVKNVSSKVADAGHSPVAVQYVPEYNVLSPYLAPLTPNGYPRYPAGPRGKGRKTANGATRRGRRRGQSEQKEDARRGSQKQENPAPAESMMMSGAHFPPLNVDGENTPPVSDIQSDKEESTSIEDNATASSKDESVDEEQKSKEASSSDAKSSAADSVSSVPAVPVSYAAIARTLHKPKEIADARREVPPRPVGEPREVGVSETEQKPEAEKTEKAKEKAEPSAVEGLPKKPIVPAMSAAVSVWESKPSAVLEAPSRCVETTDDTQLDSRPRMIQSS
uniref:HTH La-type RNA-binding domain-containing protein n=1 Tax=Rhodosorus marinus TaxID=101924 RepID=A0A7S3E8T0_9RHOD|mmetsp:Transcript_17987/g.72012  ORF Transcript_17987/g.72012 Transcript_17987/m.72012 type:complete len:457 (+) Transcript_17987:346-1716(+)|eukprot:CAMPEP_0113959504 /NCGR_PEP_ID=MMETSP0011_2-20120614/4181_1 /TAXON_ID=101924 /ORGANISM="Rhodosorus marinus" /LENGTH=456 /DNA_ID=CAMNT_0000970823 /DNA_START=297 /DNA_END=1667 /DNA_ORIENTATION=- /assembly_acc=CAM_ASM_000156